MKLRLLLALLTLALFPAHTTSASLLLTAAQFDNIDSLAADPVWLALLHYNPVGTIHTSWESQVDDSKFFLSPDGKRSPVNELRKTIDAFYLPEADLNQHAVCRFPARWYWLAAQLSLPTPFVTPEQCPDFNQWLNTVNPHSMVLVFASSYLNSPSSMFGHTFLRIDPEEIETGSNWLSFAVNFGAIMYSDDDPFTYAYKGLFGGYPGYFTAMRYLEKIEEYNRLENRDLWEYHLNLSPDEVQTIARHLWELRDIRFDYYFTTENCSYRLLELLEVARPETKFTEPFGFRAIPIDTVRSVIDAGVVNEVLYRPAEATQIQHLADQLDPALQQLAWELAHSKRKLDDTTLLQLDSPTQARVIWVAYKHLRYLQLKKDRNTQDAQQSLTLLQALRTLEKPDALPAPIPPAPQSGHDTLLVGLAGGRADGRNLVDLRLRTSYHDLTDNPTGYLNGAAINLGELQLRQREDDSLQVEMLNFVDINSHAPRNRFFDPITWRVRAGFDRVYAENDDALTARVNGGAGVTYEVGNNHLAYGMAIARLEYNPLLEDNLGLGGGALAGTLWFTPIGTLQLEAEHYQFTDGHERHELKLVHNLSLSRNDALRLNLLQRQQLETRFNEATLEYRHFF